MTSCGLNNGPLSGCGEYEARIACNLWSRDGALFYGLSNTPEAEDHPYFTQSGKDRESDGKQYIANMRDGAVAGFKYFKFDGLSEIGILVAGVGTGEFIISTKPNGTPVCRIPVMLNGETTRFSAKAVPLSGERALYFSFLGNGAVALHKIDFA